MGCGLIAGAFAQIIEIAPARAKHYYLVPNVDFGSVPCSATRVFVRSSPNKAGNPSKIKVSGLFVIQGSPRCSLEIQP
jgi:hypothetical protein